MEVTINRNIYQEAQNHAQQQGLNLTAVIENFLVRFIAKSQKNSSLFDNNWLNFFAFMFFLAISSINLFFIDSFRVLYFPLLSAYVSAYEFQSVNYTKEIKNELKGVQ